MSEQSPLYNNTIVFGRLLEYSEFETNGLEGLHDSGIYDSDILIVEPGDVDKPGVNFTSFGSLKTGAIHYEVFETNNNSDKKVFYATQRDFVIISLEESGITNIEVHEYANNGTSRPYSGEIEIAFCPSLNKYFLAISDANYLGGGNQSYVHIARFSATFQFESVVTVPLYLDGQAANNAFYGLEFSPNGLYMYFSIENAPHLGYVTMSTTDNGYALNNIGINITNLDDYRKSHLEKNIYTNGTDDAIYFIGDGVVGALVNPDTPASLLWNGSVALSDPMNELPQYHDPFSNVEMFYTIQTQNYNIIQFQNFLDSDGCCLDVQNITGIPGKIIDASNDGTWTYGNNPFGNSTEPIVMSDDLVFQTGSYTVISGMTIEFDEDAEMIIQKGAYVKLDNSTLTSIRCTPIMWPGVNLLGTNTADQSPSNNTQINPDQGKLFMNNNSIIEHAMIGVEVGTLNNNTGGILRAYNSTFRNCRADVYMRKYHWYNLGNPVTNACYFENMKFLTDDLLNVPTIYPGRHVSLYDVDIVRFKNCSFLNTTSIAPLGYLNRGTGIYSWQASFQISGENDTYDGENDESYTTFYQLEKGIEHNGNGFSNSTFSCKEMEFQLCNHGILNYTSDNIQVVLNNFLIPEIQINSGVPRGMYISNSTGYVVEQNNFYGFDDPEDNSTFPDAMGVWIFNSLGAANEIYNNHFDKLTWGTFIQKDNRGATEQTGLEIKCNLYTENRIDVYRYVNSTTRDDQGNSPLFGAYTELAGNRFSIPNFNDCELATDWVIDPYNFQYNNYYCHDEALTIPDYCKLSTHPNPPLNNILLYPVASPFVEYDESHCPENYIAGFTGGGQESLSEIESEIEALHDELNVAKTNYDLVVDDNQTSLVISNLDAAFPEESAYLRELLLQKLPLSDAVMHKMVQKANLFDPWHLTEVFLANAPLNKSLLKEIEDAEILSAFFMSFLYAADSGESLRQLMELHIRSIEELKYDKMKSLYMLSFDNAAMEDGVWDLEGYNNQLQQEEGDYIDRISVFNLAETNDYNTAIDLIANNPEIDFMTDYLLLAQAVNNDWNLAQAEQIDALWDISENEDHGASSIARGILHLLELDNSEPEPQLPIQFRSLRSEEKTEKFSLPLLGAIPNPAYDYTYVHYPIEADGHGLFELYDNYGRLLQQWTPTSKGLYYLDLHHLQSGLYHLRLSAFGKVVESLKLVIID